MEQRAHIEYPTLWTYKVIGSNEEHIRAAIQEIIPHSNFDIENSKSSSKGRFVSLNLSLTVQSDEERTQWFHQLYAHADIKMVL